MTKERLSLRLLWERKQVFIIIGIIALVILFYITSKKDLNDWKEDSHGLSMSAFSKENNDVPSSLEEQPRLESMNTVMKVDVKGEIHQPGVYIVSEEDRIIDVIERAGGFTNRADETRVNLSQKVTDEMVIYIPAIGEEVADHTNFSMQSNSDDGKVNINQADTVSLQTLPGIGPSKADAIIDYREKMGPFQKIEDIMNISGIGEKTFEKLKDSITVK